MTRPACVRCGKCCIDARVCDLRGWVVKDESGRHLPKFDGQCDQLIQNADGTWACKVIAVALSGENWPGSTGWGKNAIKFIREFTQRGCELA